MSDSAKKLTAEAMERERLKRELKKAMKDKETSYSYKTLEEKIRKLEMKKGGAVKGYKMGGECRGYGKATQGKGFKGTF